MLGSDRRSAGVATLQRVLPGKLLYMPLHFRKPCGYAGNNETFQVFLS